MAKQRIGQFLHRDIRRATVLVELENEHGDVKEIPFTFRGETFDGEHCKVYQTKQAVEDLTMLGDIEALSNPYAEENGRNVYRFHKEEVYVKSEDDIYFDERGTSWG